MKKQQWDLSQFGILNIKKFEDLSNEYLNMFDKPTKMMSLLPNKIEDYNTHLMKTQIRFALWHITLIECFGNFDTNQGNINKIISSFIKLVEQFKYDMTDKNIVFWLTHHNSPLVTYTYFVDDVILVNLIKDSEYKLLKKFERATRTFPPIWADDISKIGSGYKLDWYKKILKKLKS